MTANSPASFLHRFGLTEFRPGQEEVITAVMSGADCLCIMPTGGGKSLCYQLPAVAREGVTLVVSPLIALMKDQVDQLLARGIPATFINSSLSAAEQTDRLAGIQAGSYALVYIAPERLRNSRFLEVLKTIKVSLLAVDEAHCISEWGHDFRPDYSRLGGFRKRLGQAQTIALTATATPDVRHDVTAQLELRHPRIFINGFARKNLHFEVWPAGGKTEKEEQLLEFLQGQAGAGIIYSSTRKKCEELVTVIKRELKRKVGFYHAGLVPDERRRVQDDFMNGTTPWLVATNAFGMGVDKRDLRFVVHFDIPGRIEAYYQEAGRAGRDGLPSRCLLLFSEQDRYLREFFIDNSFPPKEVVQEIYEYLRALTDDPLEITQEELKERLELSIGNEAVSVSERLLEKAGVLERLDSRENMASVRIESDLPSLIDLVPIDAKMQRKVLQGIERIVGEVRGERVYFNPTKLAANLEVDTTAFNRAIKELMRLKAFDYCPPFRGRAIHMLDRKTPFHKLQIDWAELEERKKEEYARLEDMMQYARSRKCRQRYILDYFGDPTGGNCGLCDRCGGIPKSVDVVTADLELSDEETTGQQAAGDSEQGVGKYADILEAIRMTLAGVARTKGFVGKTMVVQMLCGSQSKEMTKRRFDELSTFGLLKFLTQTEAGDLVDALINSRLIEQVENQRFRPVVQLTPQGERVMRKEVALPANFMIADSLRQKILTGLGTKVIAAKRETISSPPVEVATKRNNDEALLAPPVAAPFSFPNSDRWDLDAVNDVLAGNNEPLANDSDKGMAAATSLSTSASTSPRYDLTTRPDFHWTWLLMDRGFSAAECQAIRRLDEATFLSHLQRAASEFYHVKWEWGLSPELQRAFTSAWAKAPTQPQMPTSAQLPAGTLREHWELFLVLCASS